LLDQVSVGFDLASLQVGNRFPRHTSLFGESHPAQSGFKPHGPNAAAKSPGARRRLIGQMGAELRVRNGADTVPGDLEKSAVARYLKDVGCLGDSQLLAVRLPKGNGPAPWPVAGTVERGTVHIRQDGFHSDEEMVTVLERYVEHRLPANVLGGGET